MNFIPTPFNTDAAETLRAVLDEPRKVLFRVRPTTAGRFAVERYDVVQVGDRKVHCAWTELGDYGTAHHADAWAKQAARRYEVAHPGALAQIVNEPVVGKRAGKSYSQPCRLSGDDEHRLTSSDLGLGGL